MNNSTNDLISNQNFDGDSDTSSLLNSTLNAIREGILVVDLKGKIVFYNNKFLEIWSIPKEIIIDRDDKKTMSYALNQLKDPDKFVHKVNQLYSDIYASSIDILEFKDGRKIERFSQPQINNNTPSGRVWSFFDISETVIIEDNLIKERDLLQALLDNIPDTIYFKDKDSKFTRVNKAQAKILGITDPAEAIGKSDFDFFEIAHATAAFNDEQKIIKEKIPLIAKVEKIRIAEGDYRWVTATKVPIINKLGNCLGIVGISRDITATKLAEEKLESYSQELKELNASKDKLFSIIAHDLRSPFNPLLGLSEIIVNDFEDLTPQEIRDYNKEIYYTLKNAFNLLENLLSWSRLETGKMKFSPEKVNLYEKTVNVINLLSGNAKLKAITLTNRVDKNSYVSADPNMLHSIIQNLTANSIKFSNKDGIIEIYSKKINENWIQITVSDNGIGMTEAQKENLFGLSVNSTKGTNDEKGTGLGFMICKEMIEKHGGSISVESKLGEGTSISFLMPHYIY